MRKAITHLKKADSVLAAIIDRVGPYRIEYSDPGFPTLVQSIVYQQLSGKAASTIFNRLKTALPGEAITPEGILSLSPQAMRALGLSNQKSTYLRDLARRTASGELLFEDLPALSDEEVVRQLTAVKGIGIWTVHMFLIFALRRVNVLPVTDLGIRVAVRKAYQRPELPSPAELEQMGQDWHPYRTIASWYLWRSLEDKNGL